MSKIRKLTSGGGSVLMLALLLCASAGIRVASSATQVLAAESKTSTETTDKAEMAAMDKAETSDSPMTASDYDREATERMLADLLERERRVTEREKEVAKKTEAIEVAKVEVQRRLDVLVQAEENLRATIALADEAAENDLAQLTTVYENMKPKDAAALFEEMDPEFSAGFLSRMRPEAAANIMTGLSPEAAYTISVILAGRNAEVPKDRDD